MRLPRLVALDAGTGREQRSLLSQVKRLDRPLYRAHVLKEHARLLLERLTEEAHASLDPWLGWAAHLRVKAMMRVAKSIKRVRASIDATLEHGLSNGRVESINTKIRPTQQRAFGVHHPSALVALTKISLSGFPPGLPGRA